jgi:L-arabinose isomerase
VSRALWRPRPDFTTSAEAWLLAGGPHHTAYSQAVGLQAIEDFAAMVGVELVAIDADTSARQFRREMRWNDAYWHLAGGI